jgi:hypothetical protein
MGWALTREENEVTNEKDEREGKPVARQLAPMISKFVRAQWESEELEGVDDERRQILEEAAELDYIWVVWEVKEEPTNVPGRWIRQPSRSGDDMRHHVEVHASHRQKEWESPSASLIEKDPEVIPDVDIAAHVTHVGRDFSLMKKSRVMNQAKDMCGSWNTRLCRKRRQPPRSSLSQGQQHARRLIRAGRS